MQMQRQCSKLHSAVWTRGALTALALGDGVGHGASIGQLVRADLGARALADGLQHSRGPGQPDQVAPQSV